MTSQSFHLFKLFTTKRSIMEKQTIFFSCFLIYFSLLQIASSSKILFLSPIGTKSHKNVYDPLIEALANSGHELTVISPLKTSKNPSIREIVPVPLDAIMGTMKDGFQLRREGRLSFITSINMSAIDYACIKMYEHEEVQNMMKNENFDLAIISGMMNDCAYGLVAHFKAPHIIITTMAASNEMISPVGNYMQMSFVPNPLLPFTNRMSFLERTLNVGCSYLISFFGKFFLYPRMEQLYRKYVPNAPSRSEFSPSLVLMNSHFSLTYPRPLLPNVIEVGGMHCKDKGQQLPKDLEDFISGAKDGVILFSLGSIVKAHNMPEETRKVFLNVFGRLKQRVIWKFETEEMPHVPQNVKLLKWVPQQEILAHENVRVFITHGGLLSTQESVFHGKPLIGLPVFADQDLNMAQAERNGFCLSLEILDITEEILETALNKVLNDPKFTAKAKELSKIYRDQPETALERAQYWVEYVIRHNGARHMECPGKDLNFLQYHSIDSFLFIFAIIFSILWLVKFILWNVLLCKIVGKFSSTKPKKNNMRKKME